MPVPNKKVEYKYGTQAEFEALDTKDNSTFHVTTDTQRIYLGDVELSQGQWAVNVTVLNENFDITSDKTFSEIDAAVSDHKNVVARVAFGDDIFTLPYMGYQHATEFGYDAIFFTGFGTHPATADIGILNLLMMWVYEAEDPETGEPSTAWQCIPISLDDLVMAEERYLKNISYYTVDITSPEDGGQSDWSTATIVFNTNEQDPEQITGLYDMAVRLPWAIRIDGQLIGFATLEYDSYSDRSGKYFYTLRLPHPYTYSDVVNYPPMYDDMVIGGVRIYSYERANTDYNPDDWYFDSIFEDSLNIESLTDEDIDALWGDGYSITCNITNGFSIGVDTILFDPVQITIIPNADYEVPEQITVTNASYTYDNYTGVVVLSDPEGPVTITARCGLDIPHDTLENTSWAGISAISEAGLGADYFAIGDTKSIVLNGTIGTLALDNYTTYVYIIDFDHNSSVEGQGITFGCFRNEYNLDVAFADQYYNSFRGISSAFVMNTSITNVGGWKDCNIRYQILGSVENRGQQNATSAAVTTPTPNTLMAALPSDLRSVLKRVVKYTDNVGGGTSAASNVTSTMDYLFLLSEKELFNSITRGNAHEGNKQTYYSYYSSPQSRIKRPRNATGTGSPGLSYWLRSPVASDDDRFVNVSLSSSAMTNANSSFALSAMFVI